MPGMHKLSICGVRGGVRKGEEEKAPSEIQGANVENECLTQKHGRAEK